MENTKSRLLALLLANENEYVSGQTIAEKIGVSRNAIWKATMKLKEEGYIIDASSGMGYRLRKGQDVISQTKLNSAFDGDIRFICLDRIDSTNNFAKKITVFNTPLCVLAEEQTGGRGRMGRNFYSPAGTGLYLTYGFKPNFAVDDALFITTLAAIAVSRAIEKVTGIETDIKWVNDVYYNGKKVCGILTEANTSFETGEITNMYVGIGINCFEREFPEDIKDKATYLHDAPKAYTREDLLIELTNQFFDLLDTFQDKRTSLINEARRKSCILGHEVLITNHALAKKLGLPKPLLDEPMRARTIDLASNGGLTVEVNDVNGVRRTTTITTGEASISF